MEETDVKTTVNFTLEYVISKLQLLNKSYWYVSDVRDYLDCSMARATYLKNLVANEYGVIKEHEDKNNTAVSADDVIKAIGGKSRLEEIEILHKSVEILRMNER